MIYIVIFIFSLLLISFFFKKKNMSNGAFLGGILFSLLPSVLLATFRDVKIGTDLSFYAIPIWSDAVAWANRETDLELKWDGIEKSYLWINFLAAQVSRELPFLLFVLQTLIMVPILFAATKMRKYVSPVFVMFIYFFTIYNETLNMIRQSLAVSMSLLAFSYLIDGKKRIAYGLYLVMLLLHGSAIVGLLVPVAEFVLTKFKLSRKQIRIIAIVVILGLGMVTIFAENLIVFGMNHGLIDGKYIAYISGGEMFGARINKSAVFYDFVVLCIVYMTYKTNDESLLLTLFLIFSLMALLFEMTGLITSYLSRMAKYPEIITVFSIPYIFEQIKNKRLKGNIKTAFCYKLFVIVFWVFTYVISNNGETFPYSSKILGL